MTTQPPDQDRVNAFIGRLVEAADQIAKELKVRGHEGALAAATFAGIVVAAQAKPGCIEEVATFAASTLMQTAYKLTDAKEHHPEDFNIN